MRIFSLQRKKARYERVERCQSVDKGRRNQENTSGTPIATCTRMTSQPKTHRLRVLNDTHILDSAKTAPMLRWVFHRGTDTLTCEVHAARRHRFDVCVIPHWDVAASSIERFDDAVSAFERHADIARRLREAGWTSVDHIVRVGARRPCHTPTPLAA